MPVNLIVCGGRDYGDRDRVFATLDRVHAARLIERIAHGGAPGADLLASQWAHVRGVTAVRFPAEWHKHGNAAGPIRNAEMLRIFKADGVVAFPGGRGTADMIARAKAAGLPVMEIDHE